MYEGIKQATDIPSRKSAPFKSNTGEIVTDNSKQMERWVEHYLDLYSRQNFVSQRALDDIADLLILSELDSEPTIEEHSTAIDFFKSRKAPGSDEIPAEIIKCGKPTLLKPLYDVLCTCWQEGKCLLICGMRRL